MERKSNIIVQGLSRVDMWNHLIVRLWIIWLLTHMHMRAQAHTRTQPYGKHAPAGYAYMKQICMLNLSFSTEIN